MNQFDRGKKGGEGKGEEGGGKRKAAGLDIAFFSFFFFYFGCSDKRVMTCKLLSYFFVLGKERWFSSGGTVPHGDFVVCNLFVR